MKIALSTSLLALLLMSACASGPRVTDHGAVAARPSPSALPEGWQRGPFMEVFVRAYQDSDGDGQGDLRGLIQRLDHLRLLGVTGLWLMPVQQSADRDHGYATQDYRAIERDYGSLADFDELLRQAHARGIGVVIDYVVNHASWQHPMFQQALQGPGNPWRDWFVWSEVAPQGWDIWGKNPWYAVSQQPWNWQGEWKDLPQAPGLHYFGTFGPHMPDFNLAKPEVFDWHLDNLRFWLNRGLDGLRLDAVPHLVERDAKDWNDQPESRALTKRLQDQILAYPNRFVVCEATAKPADYATPEVCGSAFGFGLERAIMGAVGGRAGAVQELADYFKTRPQRMATMLANHDIFAGQRIWDQVQGDEARYRLAAASLLLLPGIPFLYYGEEIGQAGLPQLKGDGPIRGPMSWNAGGGFSTSAQPFRPTSPNAATHNAEAQRADPGSLFHHYRQLVALRRQHAALHSGRYEAVQVDGTLLCFERATGAERLRVCLNYGPAARALPARGLLLWAAPQAPADTLPAWGVRVERLV
jgi:alpha-amylase